MIYDLQYLSKSKYLPSITIRLGKTVLDSDTTAGLSKIVLSEEPNIIKNVRSTDENDDQEWLTGKLWSYNFLDFDYPEVKTFKSFIKDSYEEYARSWGYEPEPVYVQCWANIIRNNGRRITPHNHASAHSNAPHEYSNVSGNICIQAENTKTYYENPFLKYNSIGIDNLSGELFMFPSHVIHWTDTNESENPRISIAFDLITKEVYNMIDNHNYRLL
jgi:hypothetical protein